jgi:hypothetical protein
MALYALGLPLGHMFSAYRSGRIHGTRVASRLAITGLALVAFSCLLRAVRYAIDHVPLFHSLPHAGLDLTLKVTAKTPPSPAYLMFFSGTGLILMALAFWLAQRKRAAGNAFLEWFAVIGRASLFVFVLQYFLYWTLPDLLGIEPNALCLVFFVGNVLLMHAAARGWARIHGNRHLTFGIKISSKSA